MFPLLPGLEEWTVVAYGLALSFGTAFGALIGLIGIRIWHWWTE